MTRGVQFYMTGLPDTAVKESYDRIRAATQNSGFKWDTQDLTINLSPANLKKEGSGFDLPMAVGIIAADGKMDCSRLGDYMMVGKLGLWLHHNHREFKTTVLTNIKYHGE